jgi:transposase, IS5 family
MKRLFELHRARYFDVAKTHAKMVMVAIAQNLLMAANKITLNKPRQLHKANRQHKSAR